MDKLSLIKEAFAALRSAKAGYPVVAVPFPFELVVISEFFVYLHVSTQEIFLLVIG